MYFSGVGVQIEIRDADFHEFLTIRSVGIFLCGNDAISVVGNSTYEDSRIRFHAYPTLFLGDLRNQSLFLEFVDELLNPVGKSGVALLTDQATQFFETCLLR